MTATIRQGLPRTPGGPAWPPAEGATSGSMESSRAPAPPEPTAGEPARRAGLPRRQAGRDDAVRSQVQAPSSAYTAVALRRGLPREAGGEPWPPPGEALVRASVSPKAHDARVDALGVPSASTEQSDQRRPVPASPQASVSDVAEPQPRSPEAVAASRRRRRVVLALLGTLAVGALAVVGARQLMQTPGMQDLVTRYPGSYLPPEGTPVGIPAWLSWQHFFNMFLIALILRTGLQVRRQERPEAYWARRAEPRTRISLVAWTHQALDALWVVNGLAYVVLLFVTGQWMRIVPTSWDVVPNAFTTAIQYLSLDWPVENGWAYYNSLQQLSYFTTVFVAAPLAIASGIRMSVYWRSGTRLDRLYPIAVARRIHVPVMLYFVAFIASHVALVLATGARRNLNHMFAGQEDAGWLGSVLLLVALAVIAVALIAVRPLLVAPVAQRFGTVSGR
ncbi:cytochrome b/b6 domain-containing protein [Demequina zhanjiangensis]|uniref:Cytochrome b/b6 domain-containing protein n=1 Tax=Demequina zhanjiangensis TaxID=3051659 RepID=A0ABT8G0I0_9MICO|nr:cytochrome b/b6 domain-containing protein [Demequina sp. SYSU T00b26]MDN4472648.1 cytochrome b/b6 domain-containing protein [Demequina sp. SYSU T00b26]